MISPAQYEEQRGHKKAFLTPEQYEQGASVHFPTPDDYEKQIKPQMTKPETEGHWKGWIKPSLQEVGKRATIGTGETAMGLASGMALYIPSKVWGTVKSIWGEEAARQAEQDIASLAYPGFTKEGQQALETVGKLFEKGLWPAKQAGEELKKRGFPRLGYYLETVGELAEFGVTGGIVKGMKPTGPPKTVAPKGVKPAYPEYAEILYKKRGRVTKEKPKPPVERLMKAKEEVKAKLAPEKAKIAARIEVKVKPIIPPAAKKIAKPQGIRSIITDIVDEGGLYDKTLPGELRDLVAGYYSKLGAEKFKRIPKLINKETGKAFDEMQSILTSERGHKIKDTNQFLELIDKDLRAIAEGKAEQRVRPLTDEGLTDKMWADYIKEEVKDGVSEREAKRTLEREIADEIAKETEFAKLEREAIQDEYRAVSEEVKPAKKPRAKVSTELDKVKAHRNYIQEQLDDVNYALKQKQASFSIERATRLNKEHLEKELKKIDAEILELTKPIQPSLIKEPGPFELKPTEAPPKRLGPQGKKAVFPTEAIKAATKGKQKTLLPKAKGEAYELFESLGFQTMYENTIKRLKTTKPQRPKEDIKRFDKGMVIKQRKAKNIKCPPVYEAELNILKKTSEKDMSHPVLHGMQNPPRVFDQHFGEDFKSMTYWQVQEAKHRVDLEFKTFQKQIKKLKKQVPHSSNKRIKIYEIAHQEGGRARLAAQGVGEIPRLTAKEMNVYRQGELIYKQFYTRLNEARKMAGKEPFGKVTNYGPFIHDLGLLEQMGLSPGLDRLKVFEEKFIQMRSVPFRHAKERAKFYDKPLELDYFGTMDKYGYAAINHIHMSPTISKLHEFTLTFGKGPAKWRFQEVAPNKARWYRAWLDHVAGKPTWDLGPVDRGLTILNKNAAYAILSGNVRSAIIQPSALMHTYVELGHKYTLEGILSLLDPKKRNFAIEKSNHLLGRNYDVAVRDLFDLMKKGKVESMKQWAGKKGLKGLQLLDYEAAMATWQGAYLRGIKKLNYTEAKAIRYADDVTIRTQASAARADVAPIQRSRIGKSLTLFQTFVINEWNFMMSDVLGYKNPKVRGIERLGRISKFIVGTTLVNMFYEDLLGLHSPYPSPIRAYREAIERGEEWPSRAKRLLQELAEKVPILSGARYGAIGPAWASKVVKLVQKGKGAWETAGTLIGFPTTTQIKKMIRAKQRGGTAAEILLGGYPEKKTMKKLQTLKLKKLKGL